MSYSIVDRNTFFIYWFFTIQWIAVNKTNHTIHWIVIYPVDSVIHLLNNPGPVSLLGCQRKR